jgi:hypothetical protein
MVMEFFFDCHKIGLKDFGRHPTIKPFQMATKVDFWLPYVR